MMRQQLADTTRGTLRFDEPLSRHTSFKVGGPADVMIQPQDDNDLLNTMQICHSNKIPFVILGGGTNVLYSDSGVRGVVIHLRRGFDAITVEPDVFGPGNHRLIVGGGTGTFQLLKRCKDNHLQGMEYLAGVPGTMGGAIRMNAGTFAGEIVNNCEWVRKLTWSPGPVIVTVPGSEMGFEYRQSNLAANEIVTQAAFRVQQSDDGKFIDDIKHIIKRRKSTQPVHLPNAGSIFKNPPGDYAGRLIEAAGLKGERIGDAEVSPMHANFIVNLGSASAADVKMLADRVQAVVEKQFQVRLEWEVKLLGDWGNA